MKNIFSFIALIMIVLSTQTLYSQSQSDSSQVVYKTVTLKDGSEVVGVILEEREQEIYFRTLSGVTMTIPRDQISKISVVRGTIKGTTLFRVDPNHTRLFFAPTGRGLSEGQGYFSAYEIFFPFLAWAPFNSFTLAGGISLLPGADEQLLYLAPKITFIDRPSFSASAGVLNISSTGSAEGRFGIFYGVATTGNQNTSFTAGLGFSYSKEKTSERPILMLGGELRVGSSTKIVTENWFLPYESGNIYTLGVRFFGQNLAADFALMRFSEMSTSGFPFIPWIGFAYNFGVEKMSVSSEPYIETKDEVYESSKIQFSLCYPLLSNQNPYRAKLEGLGYRYMEERYSSYSEDESYSTNGTMLTLKGEFQITENVGVGLSVSSLGKLVGSPVRTYFEKWLTSSIAWSYIYYWIEEKHSFISYLAIGSYRIPLEKFFGRNTGLRIGGGLGKTDLNVQLIRNRNYYDLDSYTIFDETLSKTTFEGFLTLEHRFMSLLSLALTFEYFNAGNIQLPWKTFIAGYEYDYSTNPSTKKPVMDTIPAHEFELKHTRLMIQLGIHL